MPRPIVSPEINQPSRRAPLIVGRDPGSNESAQGRPFVGEAGSIIFGGYDKLTSRHVQGAIAKAGLVREDCNITNRVLRQPWNNDFFKHSWEDIKDGHKQLIKLIEELNPSIIIATGSQAAYDLVPNWRTLTDKPPKPVNTGGANIKGAKAVLDRRGFFFYDHDLPTDAPVLVTLHPASCLYQAMPNRLLLDIDMARLGAHLRGELVRQDWPVPIRVRNSGDLLQLWESAHPVAYDIEITWGGNKFLCMAMYTREGQAFLVYGDALGACEEWLHSDQPKLCHNGQFDRYFLDTRCGIEVGGRHEDTICAHWACYPELAGKEDTGREDQKKKTTSTMTRKGLNFLASFHLDVGWWKTYTTDPVLMGQLCVNDVAATQWCWEIIEPEIDDMVVRVQYERQLSKLPALIGVQKRGFLIDEELRQDRMAALSARGDGLSKEAHEAGLSFLQMYNITHHPDGTEYWWYHDARCECCFGGELKRAHCVNCAGIKPSGANGSLKKRDLVIWAWRNTGMMKPDIDALKKDAILALVPECEACEGTGKIPEWNFNPLSSTQMRSLLFEHLDVPKYCYSGKDPDASEDTLKKVLQWAND